jgi:hypothetical protein
MHREQDRPGRRGDHGQTSLVHPPDDDHGEHDRDTVPASLLLRAPGSRYKARMEPASLAYAAMLLWCVVVWGYLYRRRLRRQR